MPADTGNLRSESPATLDDKSSKKDKKYRQYVSNVERALSLFDTALQEWADYISFLGRLLKALQTSPPGINTIAHSATVAKRLAQCLDPRLPSGVHQKALEVYVFCFSILGKEGLARDLTLYLPGLSPTLSFASLSVKPSLLGLFENHVAILNSDILQPALKAIVLALLPGLEEESSEEFERTHRLLNRFRDAVGQRPDDAESSHDVTGDRYFWQSIFLATMTSSSRRQGALQYLIRNLPRLGMSTDARKAVNGSGHRTTMNADFQWPLEVEAVISPEPGLLIRCFAAGLRDDQLLVQRGFLDLLVTHLPLSSPVLQLRVKPNDLELLISAAAFVVVRREMSLNRRLWSWFIGPEASKEPDESISTSSGPPANPLPQDSRQNSGENYFESYGLGPLTESVLKMIAIKPLAPATRARPFRICLSLMDRSEIGGSVVPRIFIPAMESIWQYEKIAPSKDAFLEVLRSAHVFFDGIQSRLIWGEIVLLIYSALNVDSVGASSLPADVAQKRLDLIWFIITKFNVREEEMLMVHMPMACVLILICTQSIQEHSKRSPNGDSSEIVNIALKIATRLLELLPERAFVNVGTKERTATKATHEQRTTRSSRLIESILHKYRENSADTPPSLGRNELASMLIHHATHILVRVLGSPNQRQNLEAALSLLAKANQRSSREEMLEIDIVLLNLLEHTGSLSLTQEPNTIFPNAAGLLSIFELMSSVTPSNIWASDHRIRQIATSLMLSFWECLSPSRPQNNVEAVRNFWRLYSVAPAAQLVESSIATLMVSQTNSILNENVTLEGARRFATLWAHSSSKLQSASDRRSKSERAKKKTSRKSVGGYSEPEMLTRPLLLLLDSLCDPTSALFIFTVSWFQTLSSIQVIMELLLHRLHSTQYLMNVTSRRDNANATKTQDDFKPERLVTECMYYLRAISNLIQHCSVTAWTSLNNPIRSLEKEKLVEATVTDVSEDNPSQEEPTTTAQSYLVQVCIHILEHYDTLQSGINRSASLTALYRIALRLLQQLLQGSSVAAVNVLELERSLIKVLTWSIEASDTLLQGSLMEALLVVLKSQKPAQPRPFSPQRRSVSQVSLSTEKAEKENVLPDFHMPSPALLNCLLLGLSSPKSRPILDQWVRFLNESLPMYDGNAFQALLPLVECFSKGIDDVFQALKLIFEDADAVLLGSIEPINTLNILLNGLEQTLARGHDQLMREEAFAPVPKTPEQAQGFFGNMVSGVFASEGQKSRPATANDRLTVLICFKDSVSIAFKIWSWGDAPSGKALQSTTSSASFNYSSIRLRNRTRRLLEHLFAAEPLECLETLIEAWRNAGPEHAATIFNLLHALEASRPKNTIPATFNAIYSRTNPIALDPRRSSTLTSELSDTDLASFLVAYTSSIDDDALDEIWTDCMAFAKDVLGNPMPQRQILPRLLEFVAILGKKIENTNFGEQRRMRRDIGDLFVRLLAATFTIKPLSFPQDLNTDVSIESSKDSSALNGNSKQEVSQDVLAIIASVLPGITPLLTNTDRMTAAATTISTQILGPTFRWKTFPQNVDSSTTDILRIMSKLPEVSKIWRKDAAEAYNDSRFFCPSTLALAKDGWMPILRQWSLIDKDRMPELLTRVTPPTSAGIMFGVGATSARTETDRKTQLNLRRIAFLLLSNEDDDFVTSLSGIQEKLTELLNATATSSPSSITRAEVYLVLRALITKISAVHLSSLWPILNTELYDALSSLGSETSHLPLNATCLLQAAKLLDILLTLAPDDFQLREWLYITDTIDAVYRPPNWKPIALVDSLAERLDATPAARKLSIDTAAAAIDVQHDGLRRPLLRWENMQGIARDQDLVDRVLRPFLRQLSITAFESTYQMESADRVACVDDLLRDIFDDGTLV